MFEVRDRQTFASVAFHAQIDESHSFFGTIPELWVPSAPQIAVLESADYSCACCGLKSAPGEIDLNSASLNFLESAKKILTKSPTSNTRSIPAPSGLMDILCKPSGEKTVYCWICRTALCPSLSAGGVRDHGVIVYSGDLAQKHVTQLALQTAYAILPEDSSISLSAEGLMTKLRRMLPQVSSTVIPGIMNGSVEDAVEIMELMPQSVLDNIETHLAQVKYLPSTNAYKTHIAYWFSKGINSNPQFMAALNG